MSRQASSAATICLDTFSCMARMDCRAPTGLRLSRTCSAIGGDRGHQGVGVGKHLVLQAQRVHLAHPLGQRRVDHRAHHRLREGAVKREIDLGDARGRGETALVGRIVAAEGANVVQGPAPRSASPNSPVDQVGIGRVAALLSKTAS